MARSTSKNAGKSKVRFIMLEAELSDGDLSEITSAIQNALRPKQPQLLIQQMNGEAMGENVISPEDLEDLIEDIDESDNSGQKPSSPKRKTTYRTPNVVDVDFETSPSLQKYASDHPPSTLVDRHLVVLGWADEASELETMNVDQVYTAFRHLGWPSNQKDFSQPLRDLKRQQLIAGNAKDGFKVNHIGRGRIEKFAAGG